MEKLWEQLRHIRIRVYRYRHGGGGTNVFIDRRRVFALDWHKFKLHGKMLSRPHYHRGVTKSQMAKHRPWQGGP